MLLNSFKNENCMVGMSAIPTNYIDLTLTDIPYDGVNRESGGIRNLDKSKADIITFNLSDFLKEVDRLLLYSVGLINYRRYTITLMQKKVLLGYSCGKRLTQALLTGSTSI